MAIRSVRRTARALSPRAAARHRERENTSTANQTIKKRMTSMDLEGQIPSRSGRAHSSVPPVTDNSPSSSRGSTDQKRAATCDRELAPLSKAQSQTPSWPCIWDRCSRDHSASARPLHERFEQLRAETDIFVSRSPRVLARLGRHALRFHGKVFGETGTAKDLRRTDRAQGAQFLPGVVK